MSPLTAASPKSVPGFLWPVENVVHEERPPHAGEGTVSFLKAASWDGAAGKSCRWGIPSVFPQWEQSWEHDWVIRWINNVFSTVPHTQWGFPGGSIVKNPPAVQGMCVRSLGRKDPLEE